MHVNAPVVGRGPVSLGMGRKHRGTDRIPALCYCSPQNKYGYTEANARAVLKQLKGRQGKGGKVESRVYLCPWGPHWHLTSISEAPYPGADT